MSNYKTVFYTLGLLQIILGVFMLIPIISQLVFDQFNSTFLVSSIITIIFGSLFVISNLSHEKKISLQGAFILTALAWISIATFGSLPFYFSVLNLSFTDSFFESMSGITTTGSTIITNLNAVPKGILLWRALLQWLGGIGIIIMAITLMPIMNVGGMQLFKISSIDTSEKILPKSKQISLRLILIYSILTVSCGFFYKIFGMNYFDSLTHSMTTLATGGFSTSDMSIGKYDNINIEFTIGIFMILGSLPFILYLQTLKGNLSVIFKDSQVQFFIFLVIISILIVTFWRYQNTASLFNNFRPAFFNTISIFTGTGYTTQDFNSWGPFIIILFLFLMLVGGCAGSTTCGIKIFRLQILYQSAKVQIFKLLNPHGVSLAKYNKKPVSGDITSSVMGYFFMFIISYIIIALILSFLGNDFLTSLSGAATSLANVGPGLGNVIGPTKTFAELSDITKWVLISGMLIGRLELLSVFIILTPAFWRN